MMKEFKISELACVVAEKKQNQFNFSTIEVHLEALKIGERQEVIVAGNYYNGEYVVATFQKIGTDTVRRIKREIQG